MNVKENHEKLIQAFQSGKLSNIFSWNSVVKIAESDDINSIKQLADRIKYLARKGARRN